MITTQRLRLVPLPAEDHLRLARGVSPATVLAPPEMISGPGAVPSWLHEHHAARIEADPAAATWLLRAMLAADATIVGHIGFHDIPAPIVVVLGDPTFRGERPAVGGGVVEIGYTVFAEHRRRGYATEAAAALVHWAQTDGAVSGVVATTSVDNLVSQGVLSRVGFATIGRCQDRDGTPELVWWIESPDPGPEPRCSGT